MFDKNTVSYLSPFSSKEILVYYNAGDVDTFSYDEFGTFEFNRIDILIRTEHLDLKEINFILKKLNFDLELSL